MKSPFCLCVYCGSRTGRHPAYVQAAQAVGRLIGERGWSLVYGGGGDGLMGETARAAMAAGAHVTGVIPQKLVEREHAFQGVSELKVVHTMHQRKHMMADMADAFVALPGGLGTLEELFEIWTWRQLGYHHKPLGLLNVRGYFDPLIELTRHATQEEFLSTAQHDLLHVEDHPATLLDILSR